jgi:hypothetical protein
VSTRTCPKCELVNPESAALCDCGHVFDQAGAEAARAAGFQPRCATHPKGPSLGAKLGWGLVGFLVAALPPFLFQELRDAVADPGGSGTAARGLAVLTGLAGVGIALAVLDRVHARRAKKAQDK